MAASPDLVLRAGGAERAVSLADVLDPVAVEAAAVEANAWIKALRHARVDNLPLRERFTHRGDSLWWFAELFLHKRQVVLGAHRAAIAFERLLSAGRVDAMRVVTPDPVVAATARSVGARHRIPVDAPAAIDRRGSIRQRAKAVFHTATSLLDRARPSRPPALARPPRVAAFVHSAFWRRDHGEEAYIGPILRLVEAGLPPSGLHLVGLGPRTNFQVRRWRDRLSEFSDPAARELPLVPVESFASWRDLEPSLRVWRDREATFRALAGSADLRAHAQVRGLDVGTLLEGEWRGLAELQFPWSARAMDEAGAALDRLSPATVVTYAEAGGWGRAIVLEARRRGIPSIGVQHGFIYRHWLNYRHEPDEMAPAPGNPSDAGFPRPDLTLLFDELAAQHLREAGHFPPGALRVTGSARLDTFAQIAATLSTEARERVRASVDAGAGEHVVLVAAKHAQMGGAFAALVRAVAGRADVRLVVKPHPAESAAPYLADAAGAPNVTVAPAAADLAALTAIARVLVTANSTAAIEAMVADVPALVVALPNNLSPFVEAGAFAGADTDGLGEVLGRLLYDEDFRERLSAARGAFMARFRIAADGRAASRSAETILHLALAPARPSDGPC